MHRPELGVPFVRRPILVADDQILDLHRGGLGGIDQHLVDREQLGAVGARQKVVILRGFTGEADARDLVRAVAHHVPFQILVLESLPRVCAALGRLEGLHRISGKRVLDQPGKRRPVDARLVVRVVGRDQERMIELRVRRSDERRVEVHALLEEIGDRGTPGVTLLIGDEVGGEGWWIESGLKRHVDSSTGCGFPIIVPISSG